MARDTLGSSSAIAGSPLTVNAGAISVGGDVIIFDGVPHVAWCEIVPAAVSPDEAHHWFGPYVARWDGSAWVLITPEGALPERLDFGNLALWPWADIAISCPAVIRRSPKLATDGTNLYVGVVGAVMQKLLNPPGNPFFIYTYYEKYLVYGFRLSGSSWVTLGDEIFGMFPLTIGKTDELYTTGEPGAVGSFMYWDISASPDSVGNCYFAVGDHGFNPFPYLEGGVAVFNHLCVVGTDLPEVLLANDSDYVVTLGGGGPSLALYYQPSVNFVVYDHDHVLVWTPASSGQIDASSFGIPYDDVVIRTPTAATWDGVRYLVFGGDFDFGPGATRWLDVVQTLDPSAPDVVYHLDPAFADFSTTDLDVALQIGGGGSYVPSDLIVEPRNYWLGIKTNIGSLGGIDWVAYLDRQCPAPSVGWVIQAIPSGFAIDGRLALYQDALWWFSKFDGDNPDNSNNVPQVWRTPICRGCAPCPPKTLHIWQRFTVVPT